MDVSMRFFPGSFESDIQLDGSDLLVDHDLETAVILSLFTDRRANDDDPIESGESKRGYWGDTYPPVLNDKYGSKLWLLRREKQLDTVLERAREYVTEATSWLLDDKVASAVMVEVGIYGAVESGILGIHLEIVRPVGISNFKYQYVWDQI